MEILTAKPWLVPSSLKTKDSARRLLVPDSYPGVHGGARRHCPARRVQPLVRLRAHGGPDRRPVVLLCPSVLHRNPLLRRPEQPLSAACFKFAANVLRFAQA